MLMFFPFSIVIIDFIIIADDDDADDDNDDRFFIKFPSIINIVVVVHDLHSCMPITLMIYIHVK